MSSTVFVLTLGSKRPKWSRYVFPFSVDAFAQLGDDLYIRAGNSIVRVEETALTDQYGLIETAFPGRVQWSWLDWGQPGVTKELEGLDYTGTGQMPSVSFGYDQRNVAALSTGYQLTEDTVPGSMIPYPMVAPSMSLRLDFAGGAQWRVLGAQLYLQDRQKGSL
jgi:hypothetical protein